MFALGGAAPGFELRGVGDRLREHGVVEGEAFKGGDRYVRTEQLAELVDDRSAPPLILVTHHVDEVPIGAVVVHQGKSRQASGRGMEADGKTRTVVFMGPVRSVYER